MVRLIYLEILKHEGVVDVSVGSPKEKKLQVTFFQVKRKQEM